MKLARARNGLRITIQLQQDRDCNDVGHQAKSYSMRVRRYYYWHSRLPTKLGEDGGRGGRRVTGRVARRRPRRRLYMGGGTAAVRVRVGSRAALRISLALNCWPAGRGQRPRRHGGGGGLAGGERGSGSVPSEQGRTSGWAG